MINNISNYLPPMLSGTELKNKMQVLPEYDISIVQQSSSMRLMALQDLYNIYIPDPMGQQIYSKMYLALMRSLKKKGNIISVRQSYENNRQIRQQTFESIIGGADSFTIIGKSGIGKSSTVSRVVSLLSENKYININNAKIIPCLQVQSPADSSVKGLLLEILRKIDEYLETNYYTNSLHSRATTDIIIGTVSQVALTHVGLLIIDEIQNVVNSKNGRSIIGTLTQLINSSGISICMVGTPESEIFFSQAMMLARRSLGLKYNEMEYGNLFRHFCSVFLSYCYVKNGVDESEGTYLWLYNHSSGNASIVVSLIHDAQELAILNDYERLDIKALNSAYNQRLSMLHDYINPTQEIKSSKTSRKQQIQSQISEKTAEYISTIVLEAKHQKANIVSELIKNGINITEVLL